MRYLSIAIIASLLRGVSTDVTCTAGTFSMGTKGFVRCDLGKDVRTGKYQFSVVHCEDALCDAHTKTYPLVCNINDGTLNCDADLVPGYSFDRLVDSSLTLIVTTVNRNTTGLYYCQVMSDGSPRHTCNLSPTGPPAVTARAPMSHSSTTKNPENQAHTESERTADLQGFPVEFVVVLAVLSVVLVVCGLLVAFIVFIRYKNSRRQDADEHQQDTETGSSRCERFAVFCKCLAPPPKPQPPDNPEPSTNHKADASTSTGIVMKDEELQVPDERGGLFGKRWPNKKYKSRQKLDTTDNGEEVQLENMDRKTEESKLLSENQDDKMAESEHLLPEGNPVVEAEVAVTSEKHTGASLIPDKDGKKKSGGGLFSKLRSSKTKKSSEKPLTSDSDEDVQLKTMDGKTEEPEVQHEKNQDDLPPMANQDKAESAESERLLPDETPALVEPENAVTPTDASPEPDAIAKQKPGTSASKWFFGKSSKGSKAQKK